MLARCRCVPRRPRPIADRVGGWNRKLVAGPVNAGAKEEDRGRQLLAADIGLSVERPDSANDGGDALIQFRPDQ
jgi:hypothetical protein